MILDGEPPVNTGDALRHLIKIAVGPCWFRFLFDTRGAGRSVHGHESCDDPAFPQCNFNPQ